ncbi:MAG: fimbria/pilus outer membrane usher protein [Eikenella sp.]|nr:fimbria/pilus outer membrane usher protein [Eikenella sp.]
MPLPNPPAARTAAAGRLRPLALALCLIGGGAAASPLPPLTQTEIDAAFAARMPVYPQVTVNGRTADGVFAFAERESRLYVQADTLAALGIAVPEAVLAQAEAEPAGLAPGGTPSAAPWLAVDSLPGLAADYRAARQQLSLTAPLAWLDLATTRIGGRDEAADYIVARPAWAAVLNYDTHISGHSSGGRSQGLLAEARLSTPAGYLSHTQSWRQHSGGHGKDSSSARLDTYWESVWPEQGLSLRLGDAATSQLGGGSASRIGGIRLSRSYAVQPWRRTAPLQAYVGATTLPATVDLYLNGVKQSSQSVPAGPYELTLPPGISGSGQASVVATDILGRTVVVDLPLYGGSGLLAKGLQEWSVEAGYLRRGYGTESSAYHRQPVASATWRRGLSNAFTLQLHAEGGGGYRQYGAAASTVLGSLGQLDASHAESRFQGRRGHSSSVFFSSHRRNWSLGAGWRQHNDGFTGMDVLLQPQAYQPNRTLHRSASLSLSWHGGRLGGFGASYLYSRSGGDAPERVAAASWQRSLGSRLHLSLGASRSLHGQARHSVYAGLSASLDGRHSLSLNSHRRSDGGRRHRAALSRHNSGINSASWQIGWQSEQYGGRRRQQADGRLRYHSQYGDGWFSLEHGRDGTRWDGGWNGGLVLASGSLFASRPVYGSFAVVDTGGVAGVPVSLFNSPAGKTNRSGRLLVPHLHPFQENRLGIDITALPPDMQAEVHQAVAVPSAGSGVAVNFPLKRYQAAAWSLRNGNGQWLAPGSKLINAAGEAVAVVGFDGRVFVEALREGRNTFTSVQPDGRRCRFGIDYRLPENPWLPDLGEITCLP